MQENRQLKLKNSKKKFPSNEALSGIHEFSWHQIHYIKYKERDEKERKKQNLKEMPAEEEA